MNAADSTFVDTANRNTNSEKTHVLHDQIKKIVTNFMRGLLPVTIVSMLLLVWPSLKSLLPTCILLLCLCLTHCDSEAIALFLVSVLAGKFPVEMDWSAVGGRQVT